MKRALLMAAAGMVMLAGASYAQDETITEVAPEEPVAQVGDCVLYAETPTMPDPKTATADDRAATIGQVIGYQAKLNEYRDCLTAVADNTELDVDAREAALAEFNRTVEVETKMVEEWQKFDKKFQKANK